MPIVLVIFSTQCAVLDLVGAVPQVVRVIGLKESVGGGAQSSVDALVGVRNLD